MFQRQPEPEPPRNPVRHQGFCAGVIRDGDGHIDVAREPRFGANGHGQAPDECPRVSMSVQGVGRQSQDGEQARR